MPPRAGTSSGRVVTRLEYGAQGVNPRSIVSNLLASHYSDYSDEPLYDGLYCQRGEAENPDQGDATGWATTGTPHRSPISAKPRSPTGPSSKSRSGSRTAPPKGAALGPMAEIVFQSTQYGSDADLTAMSDYLKSLPTTIAKRSADTTPSGTVHAAGKRLCCDCCATCHGDNGEGKSDSFPALAGNRTVMMANATDFITLVVKGGFASAAVGAMLRRRSQNRIWSSIGMR